MGKNAARAAIPAPVVTPVANPSASNVQPAASAPNVAPAKDNGASKGHDVIQTGPQLPVGQDPSIASQNRVDSARAKLISEASKTIKIDQDKVHKAEPVAVSKPAEAPKEAPRADDKPADPNQRLLDQIAKLNRQNRELQQQLKAAPKPVEAPKAEPPAADIAADAAAMKALRKAAQSDPYAVFSELEKAGMPYAKLLETFVSQKPGDNPGAATTAEANEALDALKSDFEAFKAQATKEKEEAEARAATAQQQAIDAGIREATKALIDGDKTRWELCGNEPKAVERAIAEGRKVVKQLGRDVSEDEGKEIIEAALDALEEEYLELGKRYTKAPPAPPPKRISATISSQFTSGRPPDVTQSRPKTVDDARRAAVEAAKGIRLTLT